MSTHHDEGVRQAEKYTYWSVHSAFLVLPFVGLIALLDPTTSTAWAVPWIVALCFTAGFGLVVAHTALRRGADLSASRWDRFLRREPLWGYAVAWVISAVAAALLLSLVVDTTSDLAGVIVGSVATIGALPALILDGLRRESGSARRFRPWVASGCAVAMSILAVLARLAPHGRWLPTVWVGVFLSVAILSLTVGYLNMLATTQELDRARDTAARLAVAEERLRFSRDLHDIFGRTLSAVSLKSELAAATSDAGADGAAELMREVQTIAQEALEEVRGVVRGYREVDLSSEIDGARSLLQSGGIEVGTVIDIDDLPAPVRRVLAWVVREAATNVLRHSTATEARILLTSSADDGVRLEVTNDRPGTQRDTGSGLTGLTERLADIGGRLSSGVEHNRFVVRAQVDPDALTRLRTADRGAAH